MFARYSSGTTRYKLPVGCGIPGNVCCPAAYKEGDPGSGLAHACMKPCSQVVLQKLSAAKLNPQMRADFEHEVRLTRSLCWLFVLLSQGSFG